MVSSAIEELAGTIRMDDGNAHVYRSHKGDGWARLCVVAADKADVVLPPGQASGFADEIDWVIRTGERLTAWWGSDDPSELSAPPGSARVALHDVGYMLEARGKGDDWVTLLASDKALLSKVAATLREVSRPRP